MRQPKCSIFLIELAISGALRLHKASQQAGRKREAAELGPDRTRINFRFLRRRPRGRRLKALSEATRVPQAAYLREALDDLQKKYAAAIKKAK